VDWPDWIWNDLSTRVAVAGLIVYVTVSGALVWWVSHHYVRSAATGWRWTTWDKVEDAERRGAKEMRSEWETTHAPLIVG
jgi:hypothetical protein